MEFDISLNEWSENNKKIDIDTRREFFYKVDAAMKSLHQKGMYITNFDPNTIGIKDDQIIFKNLSYMNVDNRTSSMVNNIYSLAALTIGSYVGYIVPIRSKRYCEYLKDNFNDYSYLLKEEDRDYYKDILVDRHYSYYSDHYKKNNRANVSSSNGNSLAYSKSTSEGKLLTNSDNVGNAAFMNILVIPAMITLLTLIIVITFSLLSVFLK